MLAIMTHNGSPTLVDRPEPEVGPTQVRIRTSALALNNADLSANSDEIAGFEFAGTVEAVGNDVPENLVGARVMGIAQSAFAEIVVADYRHLLPVPEALQFADAAALPTALSTEYGALRRAELRNGATVLITAATSGIALIGVQVARVLGASTVIGTTRAPDRAELVRRAGADTAILLGPGVVLAERVRELTAGEGADVVLDHVSGPGLSDALDASRKGGVVVSVGRITGPTAEIDLFRLARQQITLRSVSYGLTPPETIGNLMTAVRADLLDAVAAGNIRPIVDSHVPFDDARLAYDRLRSGTAKGKVTITLG